MSFNIGDVVTTASFEGLFSIYSGPDADGEYKLRDKKGKIVNGYYKEHQLKLTKITDANIKIGGFNCGVRVYDSKINIKSVGVSYDFPYIGDYKNFIKNNEGLISSFFEKKIEEDVNVLIREFSATFDKFIDDVKLLILPHTKDLLLSLIIDEIKNKTAKIAKLFNDNSVKNTLLNILKK